MFFIFLGYIKENQSIFIFLFCNFISLLLLMELYLRVFFFYWLLRNYQTFDLLVSINYLPSENFKLGQRRFIMGRATFSGGRIHERAREYKSFFMRNSSLIDVDLFWPGVLVCLYRRSEVGKS